MPVELSRSASFGVRLVIYAVIIILIAAGIHRARPPSHVVIEVGPVGGSFYQTAQQYQGLLAQRGIELEIRPKANSLEILPDLANPDSGVDVGFEAQDARPFEKAGLQSLGAVQLQPLFVFASADLGRKIVLTDLRGRRIVMPPAGSATSDAALRVFQLYDITAENTSFSYLPIADAARELRAGRFDAGVFMLAPENGLVRDLASWSGVRLLSLGEAKAIANHLPYLRSIVLPRGIYDIADGIPQTDVTMLAGTVDVAARPGLHPYVVYSLVEVMAAVHRGATLVSSAGDYPTTVGTDLPVHPAVEEYHRSGVPWVYRNLPPALASFVDHYLLWAIGLFVLAELYRVAHYITELGASLVEWRLARKQARARRPGRVSSHSIADGP